MNSSWWIGIAAVALVAAVAAWLAVEWIWREQLALGRRIYADDCASCHGRSLEGQADWQTAGANGRLPAPPHDASGHSWHHPDSELFLITKKGLTAIVPGYESDMPAFEGVLTDAEIEAVLAFIKSTWPEREREYQAVQSRTQQNPTAP